MVATVLCVSGVSAMTQWHDDFSRMQYENHIHEYSDIDHFVIVSVQFIHCNMISYLLIFHNSRM